MDVVKLTEAVKEAKSYRGVCKVLGVNHIGGTYRRVRNAVLKHELDTSHFSPFSRPGFGAWNKIPLEDILVEGSTYSTNPLKKRLLKEGLLDNECEVCGTGPEWNGEELVLQLDHKNGVSDDHRVLNLRIICPNCHTQTPTYVSRKN